MTDFVHELELAWAAGFFDGEGCFQYSRTNGSSEKRYCGVEISQADPEVLHRFKNAVGHGYINGPYARPPNSDMWYYSCRATSEIHEVTQILKPYLSSIKLNDMKNMLEVMKDTRKYQKRLSNDQIKIILDEFSNGLTYKEIALLHERTYESVVKLISSRRRENIS